MRKTILGFLPLCLMLLVAPASWAKVPVHQPASAVSSTSQLSALPDAQTTINTAVTAIRKKTSLVPKVALVLGSGFGDIANEVQNAVEIPFADIPGFPVSTVEGHAGHIVLGNLDGVPIAVLRGRVHYYEGYRMDQVILPIRVLHALGAQTAIFTNSSGGINPILKVGDLMMMNDHINFMGTNPLIGPNNEKIGPRFFPIAGAYTAELQESARRVAQANHINLTEGVYCAMTGPSYESPAEFKMLRLIGADAVGMSTVPEVIAANHCGMKILAISCVTDVPHYGPGPAPQTSHEAVLKAAQEAVVNLTKIIRGVVIDLK